MACNYWTWWEHNLVFHGLWDVTVYWGGEGGGFIGTVSLLINNNYHCCITFLWQIVNCKLMVNNTISDNIYYPHPQKHIVMDLIYVSLVHEQIGVS